MPSVRSCDVVALEGRGPDAVVAHRTLRARRVVRDHLLQQVGATGELLAVVLEQHLLAELADLVDRRAVALPVRVDAHALERPVAHPPEDGEPVELAVGGHVAVQPDAARARSRRGSRASARATAACAGTPSRGRRPSATSGMNCSALAPVPMTATRLPVRSRSWRHSAEWKYSPAKSAMPSMVGHSGRFSWPTAEMTASPVMVSAHAVAQRSARSTAWSRRSRRPTGRRCRSGCAAARRRPRRSRGSTRCEHTLGRVVERPVVALRERVAVVVVRVVDAAARVDALVPRAADVVVLVEDRERHPGLLQAMRRQQPGHARADDHHVERTTGSDLGDVPPRSPTVLARDRRAPPPPAAGTPPSAHRRRCTPGSAAARRRSAREPVGTRRRGRRSAPAARSRGSRPAARR